MNSITVFPDSESQYFLLKNLLEEMKIKFTDSEDIKLTEFQKEILDSRLQSVKKGKVKSRDEARKIFKGCLK